MHCRLFLFIFACLFDFILSYCLEVEPQSKHFSNFIFINTVSNCIFFSLTGFRDAITIETIDDEDIKQIERFMREEWPQILVEKSKIEPVDYKQYYGDVYASLPHLFKFSIGDLKLIKLIVDRVKEAGVKYFASKRGNDAETKENLIERLKGADLKSKLYKTIAKKLASCPFLSADLINQFDDSMVAVEINESNAVVTGSVKCLLCLANKIEKYIKVTLQFNGNTFNWIPSNLTNHFQKHNTPQNHHINEHTVVTSPYDVDSMPEPNFTSPHDVDNIDEPELNFTDAPIFAGADGEVGNLQNDTSIELDIQPVTTDEYYKNMQDILFKQIGKQSYQMMAAAFGNNETEDEIDFELDNNQFKIKIIEVIGDGNCLFRSLQHQLQGEALNKTDKSVTKLRKDVVNHIKHFTGNFHFELRQRVFEIEEKKCGKNRQRLQMNEAELRKKCHSFLFHSLPRSYTWGGMETNKAVSNMYKVNIVILNENGTCYFANGFDVKKERTLLVSYNQHSKHYNSVSGIGIAARRVISRYLMKAIKNQNRLRDETKPIDLNIET